MASKAINNNFSKAPLSEEEQNAAAESLSVYCKPVELYNILQRRALNNPLLLQRSLLYKFEERRNKKIQVSVSIRGANGDGQETPNIFPVYIVLARKVPPKSKEESRILYCLKQACKLTAFSGAESSSSTEAKFILPEINKLSTDIESGSVAMLMVSCDTSGPLEIDLTKDHLFSSESDIACYCRWGKIPIDVLRLGKKVEMMPTVRMKSWLLKLCTPNKEKYPFTKGKWLSFELPISSEPVHELPIAVSSEQLGAEDKPSSRGDSGSNNSPSFLPREIRPKAGDVIFNYHYYRNLFHRTEVSEDFKCPFCMVKCATYKGLKYHLPSSHDLFSIQFWSNDDYQVVNVAVKSETSTSETGGNNLDPRVNVVYFCRKPLRRKPHKISTEKAIRVLPPLLDSDTRATTSELRG